MYRFGGIKTGRVLLIIINFRFIACSCGFHDSGSPGKNASFFSIMRKDMIFFPDWTKAKRFSLQIGLQADKELPVVPLFLCDILF